MEADLQRTNSADPVGLMAQQMAELLVLRRGPWRVGPVGGVEGTLELLGGMAEFDELGRVGRSTVRNVQLSFIPSASLTTAKSGRWPSTASTAAATVDFGIALI